MKNLMPALVGNNALKKRLCADILASSLSHAYILEGKKGSGKHTVARLIASSLSCENKQDPAHPLPCGVCPACRKISEGICPDVMTFSRESGKATFGVETVRTIRADVATVPGELDYKFYIIEDADLMTVQAQNALLLTLEEPPSFVLFLLLAESSHLLLETIRSRAPVLRLESIPEEALDRYLRDTQPAARALRNSQPDEYAALLTASDGAIGEALRLLEPKARKALFEMRELSESVIRACLEKERESDLLSLLSSFPQKRPDAILQLCNLLTAVRDLILLQRADQPHLCFFPDRERAADYASRFSSASLFGICREIEQALSDLDANANLTLTLTRLSVALGE